MVPPLGGDQSALFFTPFDSVLSKIEDEGSEDSVGSFTVEAPSPDLDGPVRNDERENDTSGLSHRRKKSENVLVYSL